MVGGLEALTDVRFAVGPMATDDASSLRTLVKAVLADEPWLRDPLVAEMPWREDAYEATKQLATAEGTQETQGKKQLVIGIAPTDGVLTPQPPVLRAVETVAAVLRAQGHVVIPFPPADPKTTEEAIELWGKAAYADLTYAHAQFRASGEPVDRLMPPAFDPEKIAQNPPLGADEVQKVNVRIRKYRTEYLRRWGETAHHPENTAGRAVDVVIMPVAPYSAVRIGGIRYIGEYFSCEQQQQWPVIVRARGFPSWFLETITDTVFFHIGYPLPVVLNDQSAAVLPVITTDKAIDVVRPLEVPEGIRDEYVRANKKIHQDCKFSSVRYLKQGWYLGPCMHAPAKDGEMKSCC